MTSPRLQQDDFEGVLFALIQGSYTEVHVFDSHALPPNQNIAHTLRTLKGMGFLAFRLYQNIVIYNTKDI